jgi:hypothetical protein
LELPPFNPSPDIRIVLRALDGHNPNYKVWLASAFSVIGSLFHLILPVAVFNPFQRLYVSAFQWVYQSYLF